MLGTARFKESGEGQSPIGNPQKTVVPSERASNPGSFPSAVSLAAHYIVEATK